MPAGAKRREERVKLAATALSNVGVAFVVTGIVAPLLLGRFSSWQVTTALAAGFAFHLVAQGLLEYVVANREQA